MITSHTRPSSSSWAHLDMVKVRGIYFIVKFYYNWRINHSILCVPQSMRTLSFLLWLSVYLFSGVFIRVTLEQTSLSSLPLQSSFMKFIALSNSMVERTSLPFRKLIQRSQPFMQMPRDSNGLHFLVCSCKFVCWLPAPIYILQTRAWLYAKRTQPQQPAATTISLIKIYLTKE